MYRHDRYGGIENYREELVFDRTGKQKCENCNSYSGILTRHFYKVEGHQVIPDSSKWCCSNCHKKRIQ